VFAGLYPTDTQQYEDLRDALEKLQLNDASLRYEPETSTALGFGFRCGFLGLLHMEIVRERLEREFDLSLVTTVPTVEYRVHKSDGELLLVENPARMPTGDVVSSVEEPFVKARIMAPGRLHRRDHVARTTVAASTRDALHRHDAGGVRVGVSAGRDHPRLLRQAEVHLARVCVARLRNPRIPGRATSFRLDMLINGDPVDAFSVIIHRDKAYDWGHKIAVKLKELIPRQLFEVAIQAAIGNK